MLFNLHRRGLPTNILKDKADEYVAAGLVRVEDAKTIVRTIEQERGASRIANDAGVDADPEGNAERVSTKMTHAELLKELERKEGCLQAGGADGCKTDQWRIYKEITKALSSGTPLRMMVQASAGTGKSLDLNCLGNCSDRNGAVNT